MENQIEEWRPVVGWEDCFHVSSLGRIRRIKPARGMRSEFLRGAIHPTGYLYVHLRDDPKEQVKKIHRLVLEAFVGKPTQQKSQANHKNGNRIDNRLENLEWVSCSENHLHAYRVLGRAKVCNKGSSNGRSRLSDSDVRSIRRRYADKEANQKELAEQFGVHQTMIGFIVRGENWTHV